MVLVRLCLVRSEITTSDRSGSLITKVNWQLANTLDETLVF